MPRAHLLRRLFGYYLCRRLASVRGVAGLEEPVLESARSGRLGVVGARRPPAPTKPARPPWSPRNARSASAFLAAAVEADHILGLREVPFEREAVLAAQGQRERFSANDRGRSRAVRGREKDSRFSPDACAWRVRRVCHLVFAGYARGRAAVRVVTLTRRSTRLLVVGGASSSCRLEQGRVWDDLQRWLLWRLWAMTSPIDVWVSRFIYVASNYQPRYDLRQRTKWS